MFKEMSSINYVYSLETGLDNITFYICLHNISNRTLL